MEILSIIKHFMADSTMQVKFHRQVMKIENLDRNQATVLKTIDDLYQLFPDKTTLTFDEVRVYLSSKNPGKDITYLTDVIIAAQQTDIGPEITQSLIEGLVEFHMATKAVALSAPIMSNQQRGGWYDGILEIVSEYEDLVDSTVKNDALQECDATFEDAINFRARDSGLAWPVSIMNDMMGGAEPSLGLVIARSDTGKTSFILNCLAYFAYQLNGSDTNLLYCGNEEGILGLKARAGVSMLGCTTEWAEQNPRDFQREVAKRGGDLLRFHGGVRSTRDVETLLKRYNPAVMVADQIAKFKLPGLQKEGPAGLADIYSWFRGKAQEYSTCTIGVAQADKTAHNKEWLDDTMINASKTDVPGELDWGVGIGFLTETGMEYTRFINLFKNKQKYGRKGRAQVKFNPETCRYKG